MEKLKYPSINGLRAISILLVLGHHLVIQNDLMTEALTNKWLKPFLLLLTNGPLGVNTFFVISGFLITSLMLQEELNTHTISLRKFYARRTLRIFPAYFFLLFVYLILQLLNYIYIPGNSWITAITYTKYFNWQSDFYTGHAWSLSVEEHFYLLWPLIFIAGDKPRKYIAMLMVCLVPIIRIPLHFHPVAWMSELSIFTRIDAIAMGCLLALYKDEIIQKINGQWRKLFYLALISLLLLQFLPEITKEINVGFVFIPFGDSFGTFANIFISIVILYSVFGPKSNWFNVLNSKVFNYIGLLSYSLYLWQQIFINKTTHWINQFPQNIIFVFAAAMFSYYLIEKPFLKLKKRFS